MNDTQQPAGTKARTGAAIETPEELGEADGGTFEGLTARFEPEVEPAPRSQEFLIGQKRQVSLDEFFTTVKRYLRKEIDADVVAETLGPPPSGQKRMNFYRWACNQRLTEILHRMFPALCVAIERHKFGMWDRVCTEYARDYPPTRWQVSAYGEQLGTYLAKLREKNPEIPVYIEEIYDFHWTRFMANHAKPVEGDDVMDKTVFVRQYTYTVPKFVLQVDQKLDDVELPAAKPQVVIIYQSVLTKRGRVFHPNLPTLLALSRRTQTATDMIAKFADKVTPAEMEEGDAQLVEHGVLRARPASAAG